MKLVSFLLAGWLLVGVQQAVPQEPPASKGQISGIVLDGDSDEPLPGVNVSVSIALTDAYEISNPSVEYSPAIPTVLTDGRGRFSFEVLDALPYRIIATANGYLNNEYGSPRSGEIKIFPPNGKILHLSPKGAIDDVVLRMYRGGSVSGRVVANGQPVVGMGVAVVRPIYDSSGRREPAPVACAVTNDRGEYRIFNIPKGRFYLATEASFWCNTAGGSPFRERTSKYPMVLYPSERDSSSASLIEVAERSDLKDFDFALVPVTMYRIRGRLVDSTTGRAPQGRLSVSWYSADDESGMIADNAVNFDPGSDGAFETPALRPGKYWLLAGVRPELDRLRLSPASPQEMLPTSQAIVPVEILAGDVANLTILMSPKITLRGRVSLDEQSVSVLPGFDRIEVSLEPPKVGNTFAFGSARAQIRPDGTFMLDRVQPAKYRFVRPTLPAGVYVKAVTLDSTDVLSNGADVSTTSGTLDVVLSAKAGVVEGTVRDERLGPVENAQTVLVPRQFRRRTDLYFQVASDSKGHFEMRAVPPGDYDLYAWDNAVDHAYFDENYLRLFEGKGVPVHVEELARISITVPFSRIAP